MPDMEKESKNYEIAILTRSEEGWQEAAGLLKSRGADIVGEIRPARIRLAYPVKKESFAFFSYLNFSVNPRELREIKQGFEMNQKILRFLIVVQPTVKIAAPLSFKPTKRITPVEPIIQPVKRVEAPPVLSNEALEKKLEEILK